MASVFLKVSALLSVLWCNTAQILTLFYYNVDYVMTAPYISKETALFIHMSLHVKVMSNIEKDF